MTVVSAAAVAAAVAVAVPVGLNLHLTPPSANGAQPGGEGASPTHRTHSSDGSATPIKSPSPSPAATHPAITPGRPPTPCPPNFQPVLGHVRELAAPAG